MVCKCHSFLRPAVTGSTFHWVYLVPCIICCDDSYILLQEAHFIGCAVMLALSDVCCKPIASMSRSLEANVAFIMLVFSFVLVQFRYVQVINSLDFSFFFHLGT